jgi:hypothetical protein
MAKNIEDMNLDELDKEEKRLRVIDLRERVSKIQARNKQLQLTKAEQEATFAQNERQRIAREKSCTHRKGGKDQDLKKLKGKDQYYSIWTHQEASCEVHIMCSRCGAQWWPGDEGYAVASEWPTDNIASGACLSSYVPTHQEQVAAAKIANAQ